MLFLKKSDNSVLDILCTFVFIAKELMAERYRGKILITFSWCIRDTVAGFAHFPTRPCCILQLFCNQWLHICVKNILTIIHMKIRLSLQSEKRKVTWKVCFKLWYFFYNLFLNNSNPFLSKIFIFITHFIEISSPHNKQTKIYSTIHTHSKYYILWIIKLLLLFSALNCLLFKFPRVVNSLYFVCHILHQFYKTLDVHIYPTFIYNIYIFIKQGLSL